MDPMGGGGGEEGRMEWENGMEAMRGGRRKNEGGRQDTRREWSSSGKRNK
jgi:hypothetical protein